MIDDYGPILDILIIVLLMATIVYAGILNRRLSRFRDTKVELERATRSFAEAAVRADAGLRSLREIAGTSGPGLTKAVDRAQTLREELSFLVETAEALAVRLEGAARGAGGPGAGAQARSNGKATAGQTGSAEADSAVMSDINRQRASRELLKALENLR
ncbi:MAG: DUF6468 domain-containing protein [Inquilinaceae bacterium]